jgi:hypothetical protein
MTNFNVDALARRYARVLLSRRVLRALAVATFVWVLLSLILGPVVLLTTEFFSTEAVTSRKNASQVIAFGTIAAGGSALVVLYLHTLSRLALGSRRAAVALMAVVTAWFAVIAIAHLSTLLQPGPQSPAYFLALDALVIDGVTAWAMFAGPFELWRANKFAREVFSQRPSVFGTMALAARLLDVPDLHAFSRSHSKRAWLLASLALLLEGLAFFTLLRWSNSLTKQAVREYPGLPSGPMPIGFVLGIFVLVLGLLFLSFVSIRWLLRRARRLRLAARSASVTSADDILAADRRAPVLFLRSFSEDQVPLTVTPIPRVLRGFDPGTEFGTLEEMIVHGLSDVGPVVAIANPRSYDMPVGAARWQVGDAQWQGFVANQIDRATLVVVGVSETHGLQWEIEALKTSPGALAKTIFICPLGPTQDAALLRRLATMAGFEAESTGDLPDTVRFDHVLAMALLPSGPACFVSRNVTELSYYVAIRSCVVAQRRTADFDLIWENS